jgi:FdhE protein
MIESLERMREQIARKKREKPAYREILELYESIKETQEAARPSPDIVLPELPEDLRKIETREGFPLLSPDHFAIDLASSVLLFESICHVARDATEKLRINIRAIEEATTINALHLRELLKRHSDQSFLEATAREFNIDSAVLKFLVRAAVQPSLEANVSNLEKLIDPANWLRGYCPICGSLPNISELKGEGQRRLSCSFCKFLWPAERLKCPFCQNRDTEKLHYIYEEGFEAYRADLCDNCKQYIKTVDMRKLGFEPELDIEDITSIHLDILASEEGFRRPTASPWGI